MAATSPNRSGADMDSIPNGCLRASGEVPYAAKHGIHVSLGKCWSPPRTGGLRNESLIFPLDSHVLCVKPLAAEYWYYLGTKIARNMSWYVQMFTAEVTPKLFRFFAELVLFGISVSGVFSEYVSLTPIRFLELWPLCRVPSHSCVVPRLYLYRSRSLTPRPSAKYQQDKRESCGSPRHLWH